MKFFVFFVVVLWLQLCESMYTKLLVLISCIWYIHVIFLDKLPLVSIFVGKNENDLSHFKSLI